MILGFGRWVWYTQRVTDDVPNTCNSLGCRVSSPGGLWINSVVAVMLARPAAAFEGAVLLGRPFSIGSRQQYCISTVLRC